MDAYKKLIVVTIVIGLAIGSTTTGITGQVLCGLSIDELMACKPSVTSQNPSPPSPACCSALPKADFQCFCNYKNSPFLRVLGIDVDQAMQLPAKCNMPVSPHC